MARQPMPKALSSLQSVQRSYTSEFSVVSPVIVREFGVVFGEEGSCWGVVIGEELLESFELVSELSWYPREEEGNLQFGSNQDSVGKGCQKSGCGGYGDCRVVVI
jgi:hypothetical protein